VSRLLSKAVTAESLVSCQRDGGGRGDRRGRHLFTQQGLPQLRDLLADLSLEAEESLFELFLSHSLLLLPREEEAGVAMG
jgi:hypothetical protein